MKWFGKPGGAAFEADTPHVETPVGEACARCDEPIEAGDDGVLMWHIGGGYRPLHYECQLRQIVGGLNHQMGRCYCCGGDQPPDPPGSTKREAARAATSYYHAKQNQRGTQ